MESLELIDAQILPPQGKKIDIKGQSPSKQQNQIISSLNASPKITRKSQIGQLGLPSETDIISFQEKIQKLQNENNLLQKQIQKLIQSQENKQNDYDEKDKYIDNQKIQIINLQKNIQDLTEVNKKQRLVFQHLQSQNEEQKLQIEKNEQNLKKSEKELQKTQKMFEKEILHEQNEFKNIIEEIKSKYEIEIKNIQKNNQNLQEQIKNQEKKQKTLIENQKYDQQQKLKQFDENAKQLDLIKITLLPKHFFEIFTSGWEFVQSSVIEQQKISKNLGIFQNHSLINTQFQEIICVFGQQKSGKTTIIQLLSQNQELQFIDSNYNQNDVQNSFYNIYLSQEQKTLYIEICIDNINEISQDSRSLHNIIVNFFFGISTSLIYIIDKNTQREKKVLSQLVQRVGKAKQNLLIVLNPKNINNDEQLGMYFSQQVNIYFKKEIQSKPLIDWLDISDNISIFIQKSCYFNKQIKNKLQTYISLYPNKKWHNFTTILENYICNINEKYSPNLIINDDITQTKFDGKIQIIEEKQCFIKFNLNYSLENILIVPPLYDEFGLPIKLATMPLERMNWIFNFNKLKLNIQLKKGDNRNKKFTKIYDFKEQYPIIQIQFEDNSNEFIILEHQQLYEQKLEIQEEKQDQQQIKIQLKYCQ